MPKPNSIHLVNAEPPEDEVQRLMDHMERTTIQDFASELDTARKMWRKHRALVEAPQFDETLRVAFVEANEHEPGHYALNDDFMKPGYHKKLRRETIEYLGRKKRSTAA